MSVLITKSYHPDAKCVIWSSYTHYGNYLCNRIQWVSIMTYDHPALPFPASTFVFVIVRYSTVLDLLVRALSSHNSISDCSD